jgi:hypothetical protein
VLELVIPIAVGVAAAFVWIALWALVLRAFGIPILMRTPEERADRKQRIFQIGKGQYVFIFGVLGNGFAMGLGIAIAIVMHRHSIDWGLAVMIFVTVSLLSGCVNGLRSWNELFHKEVPFPPAYPPQK